MSNAASQIDNGYDQTLSDLSVVVTGDKSTEYIEAWARTQFGDKMYEAASALKMVLQRQFPVLVISYL